ncbi:hypothetical protein HELRODRAFT_177900 [Helobdella robusta]|uniref:Uncharacterized protein n=1 Tax=Helobdella robusta TaxID=6412 RepID=T1FCG1_HELRO|nr:hypothetical protein HELRODRAFT_177900 [Helobdella robusta]ESN97479.1 hypothetical protein HELRODRAFT_177900 [Helobdella robusta]
MSFRSYLQENGRCVDTFDYVGHYLKDDLYYPNQTTKIEFRDKAACKPIGDSLTSYNKCKTLVGNWLEERNDVRFLRQGEPICGEYSHLYCTTYGSSFNKKPVYRVPSGLKNFVSYPTKRHGVVYPSHQPELDLSDPGYYHWSTTYLQEFIKHPYSKRVCVPSECKTSPGNYK